MADKVIRNKVDLIQHQHRTERAKANELAKRVPSLTDNQRSTIRSAGPAGAASQRFNN